MKARSVIGLVAAILSSWMAPLAQAQNNPNITVDENGTGSLVFPGGGTFATAGVLAPDPGPGGLPAALTYNLLGPPSLVAGDLLLLEPGGGGILSEIIRFNPAGTSPGYPASLVFYSDNTDGADALADTGFPGALYANTVSQFEVGPETGPNGFTYTPSAGGPGFISGFGVTYTIQSDPAVAAPTPEPGTLCMMVAGLGGLAGSQWRKRRRREAIT